MIENNDKGLKVAYRGTPTEAEVRLILKKRKIARIINTIVFIILLTAASYFSYIRYKSMNATVPENEQITEPGE